MTINDNLFKRTCKVATTKDYMMERRYGEYLFFKVGTNYVLMHGDKTILRIMDGIIEHEKAYTKAEDKAIRTIKYMMDLI